jgi:hypothetical protein
MVAAGLRCQLPVLPAELQGGDEPEQAHDAPCSAHARLAQPVLHVCCGGRRVAGMCGQSDKAVSLAQQPPLHLARVSAAGAVDNTRSAHAPTPSISPRHTHAHTHPALGTRLLRARRPAAAPRCR